MKQRSSAVFDRVVMFFAGGFCGAFTALMFGTLSGSLDSLLFLRAAAIFVVGCAVAGSIFQDRLADFFTTIWSGF